MTTAATYSGTSYDKDGNGGYVQVSTDGIVQPEPEIVIVDAQEVFHENTPLGPTNDTASTAPSSLPHPTTGQQQQSQSHHVEDESTFFDCILCGDEKRSGPNVRPGTNFSLKLCGKTHITLPNDAPPGAHYRFIVMNLCGDMRLFVPRGTIVSLRRLCLCGSRTMDLDTTAPRRSENSEELSSGAPRVTVTIVQLCGDVRIMNYRDGSQKEWFSFLRR